MGDRTYANITIAGKIKQRDFERLPEALDNEGLLVYGHRRQWPTVDLGEYSEFTPDRLYCEADEVDYGEFDDLECWLEKRDIHFTRYNGSGGCYNAAAKYFRGRGSDDTKEIPCLSGECGGAAIRLETLSTYIAQWHTRDMSAEEILLRIEEEIREPDDLAPLEIVPSAHTEEQRQKEKEMKKLDGIDLSKCNTAKQKLAALKKQFKGCGKNIKGQGNVKDDTLSPAILFGDKKVIIHTEQDDCGTCPLSLYCMQQRPLLKERPEPEKAEADEEKLTKDEDKKSAPALILGYCEGCHTVTLETDDALHVCGLLRLGQFSRLKLQYGLPEAHIYAALGEGGWAQKANRTHNCRTAYEQTWVEQRDEEEGKPYEEVLTTDDIRELLRKDVAVECIARARVLLEVREAAENVNK